MKAIFVNFIPLIIMIPKLFFLIFSKIIGSINFVIKNNVFEMEADSIKDIGKLLLYELILMKLNKQSVNDEL